MINYNYNKFTLTIILITAFNISANSQKLTDFITADSALNKGIEFHDDKQYEKAIEFYKKVSSNDPNYPLALYEIALSFYEQKKYDSALVYATESSQYEEYNIYEAAIILRGQTLIKLEQFTQAIQNFDAALAKFPKNVSYLHHKGQVYKHSKEYQKAIDAFKEVNVEYSGYIKNQLAIAELAEEEGLLTQAFLAYTHALLYSIGTHQHLSILLDLNELAAKKLEENPKSIVISTEGDQFGDIENLLKTQAALQKKYKINTEIDLPIVRQLHLLFAQLENYEPTNGYFDQYYVPFYKELAKEGKFNQFIDILFLPVNDPQIQRLLSRRSQEIAAFADELGIKLAKTVNKRELTINGKQLTLPCHFGRGIKSCGNYNESNKKEGTWYFYHPNGNLQRFGELIDGKANNFWEYYSSDGKKNAEYTLKDNKKDGPYKRFFANGKLREEGNYKEDSLEGKSSAYFMNGNLRSKGSYVNNKYNGEWRTYYANGLPRGTYNYKEDLFDGMYTSYAMDGKTVTNRLNYKNGKLDGRQETFYLNGNKKEEGEFNLGTKIGEHKEYFTNGVLKESESFEEGEISDQKEYYVNGNIYSKYVYKKGDIESMDVHDYDGNLATTYRFKNDYLKQMITYDKQGQELEKESIGKNDEFIAKWFYTNNPSMQGNYKKGKRHGKWIFYNLNGTKDNEANYELGIKHGIQRNYNAQGFLTAEYMMKNGDYHGYSRTYYESGELKSEEWYLNDKKNGPHYDYYIDGTLKSELYYLNDNVEGKYIDYDPDGKAIAIYNYKDDEFVSYSNLDRNGNELNKVSISENKTEMKPCSKISFASYKKEKIFGLNEGATYSEPLTGMFDFKGNYLSGEFHGLLTYYFPNENKYVSSNYLLGKKDGADTVFYHNGAIYSTEMNVLGSTYGKYSRYYYNGQIWQEKNYVNGNIDGIINLYGINGEMIVQKIYKLGFFYGIIRRNESGEFLDTIKANNETLEYEAKYKNGQVGIKESIKLENFIYSEYYDDKGQRIYKYEGDENGYDISREYFYTNGKTLSTSKYSKGQLTEKNYYRIDGSLDSKEEFKFDQTHGKTIVTDVQGNNKLNVVYRKNVAYELGQ